MAQSKVRPSSIPSQDVIVVQRLTTVAEVRLTNHGQHSPVEAAFLAAGAYLDRIAGQDGESAAVQFEYLGATFHASCEVPEEVNAPPSISKPAY